MVKRENHQQQAPTTLENIDATLWKISPIRNSDQLEKWIPITSLDKGEIYLGISQAGYWVLEVDNYITFLLESRHLRGLLPCLKIPFETMVSMIEQELSVKGLPVEMRNRFPFQSLILLALKNKSDFWASLALDWLNNFQSTDFVNEELRKLVQAKWISQKTKQKAKKNPKRLLRFCKIAK